MIMENATHFVEIFKNRDQVKLLQSPLNPIKFLSLALKNTANSKDLKTIAVWFIKVKNHE